MSTINIDKHKFLVLFSYIGTKYSGIQRQTARVLKEGKSSSDNTVQFYIEQSLETINPKPSQDVKFSVSSRTDRGVHAFENSAQLEISHPNPMETYCPSHLIETANDYFKSQNHDIKLNKIHLISPEFHFRKHIKWRSYYYRLAVVKPEISTQSSFQPESYIPINELNRCSLVRVPLNLDLDIMSEAVDYFQGTHNFSGFAAFSRSLNFYSDDYFTRTIDSITFNQIDCEPLEKMDPAYRNINLYEFNITSKGFLYRQIRRMVGAIIMVGSGQFSIDRFKSLLDNPQETKWTTHFYTAPPEGLYLSQIKYDPKDFLNPPDWRLSDSKDERPSKPLITTGQFNYDAEDDNDIEDENIINQIDYNDDGDNQFKCF
ncbi:tRNA pseudouridine synthase-like 1 [Panonychus citri]|uniref:tRNA pseudouridine synthase-like 1 n=1 Tax=Panonychus citri TaxID=50023 RepID=UPI002307D733|nr:tRNA pseudouridine synthase-like 1 [Panonychus citri]